MLNAELKTKIITSSSFPIHRSSFSLSAHVQAAAGLGIGVFLHNFLVQGDAEPWSLGDAHRAVGEIERLLQEGRFQRAARYFNIERSGERSHEMKSRGKTRTEIE